MKKKKVWQNTDHKYDLQLTQALINEKNLSDIFEHELVEKIELKTESWQWEKTGNIVIEYKCDGKPSGIAVTEATCWVHELKRDGQTLCYLMFPIGRLKQLARKAIKEGRWRDNAGDNGRFHVALISLSDILA